MDYFKSEAIKEFKNSVMYIGAFVDGALPKNEKIISEELPDKNPENGNHVTLFFLGNLPEIGEELFDDILNLPEGFTVAVSGYGYDGKNQGISVSSKEYDFNNIHLYGNTKAVPHISYSWNTNAGGPPERTGWIEFGEIPDLEGIEIKLRIKAFLYSGEMIPLQYFRDRAAGVVPPLSVAVYNDFSNHDQNTPFHCFDLRMHTIKVVEYVRNNFDRAVSDFDLRIPLEIAAQWHDVGKLFTKGVNKDGFNIYKGHPQASATEFDKNYNGENKQLISFFISNHDYFLFYKKEQLTDELVDSLKNKIQSETSFEITKDQWQALALLMEADESAKNPIVEINGKIVRTMEDDFDKIHYLKEKLIR